MVDSFVTGLCSGIQQNTNLRVELSSYSVEQPPMRVDLLGIFLLKTEDDLHWHLWGEHARGPPL